MTMIKTVHDYTAILASLQRIAPEAHIAGGAVRDTVIGKAIHDIDVFMNDKHVEEAAARLRADHGYVKVGEWQQYLGFSDPAMTRVAKFEKADETIPICVIGLRPEYAEWRGDISRFDFGICMAAFDGDNIIRTDEFERDAEGQTFTLLRADNEKQFDYSMSRFDKITTGRYRGWTLAIPEEFREFAKKRAFREYYRWESIKGMDSKYVLKPKERVAANA